MRQLSGLRILGASLCLQCVLSRMINLYVPDGGMRRSILKSERVEDRQIKRRRSQSERRAETRARLLDASIRLLQEKGFSRFRIGDAAALAGVSRGGQTHHFATKGELIEATIEALFEKEVESAHEDANLAAGGEEISSATKHFETFQQSDLYQVSLRLVISARSVEQFSEGIRAISAGSRQAIEQAWIDRFVKSGAKRKKAEESFGILASVLRGFAVQESIKDEDMEIGPVKELAMELVKSHLQE
ncbi:hypothetical protein L284_19580 [Novosphingobium lindaniclasticum LE124]|uniref:HTH tetR-type domain-containing protein n=2 Tax=Novosphingobium TaxID=165696 RepID=T0GZV8_9SPHN|nr:hypothetical protein L284_19580 [Novosphingobium lindaniclasticum LE124]